MADADAALLRGTRSRPLSVVPTSGRPAPLRAGYTRFVALRGTAQGRIFS